MISPDCSLIKPHQDIAYSSVNSFASQNNGIREIQSVYYKFRSQQASKLSQIFNSNQNFKKFQDNKNSLSYSNSPIQSDFQQMKNFPNIQSNSFKEPNSANILSELQKSKLITNEIDNFLLYHQRFVPRPEFSAINTFNPAFRRLEEIKRQLRLKMSNSEQWLKSGALQFQREQFYPIPPQQLLQIVSQSTNQCNKKSIIVLQEKDRIKQRNTDPQQKSRNYVNCWDNTNFGQNYLIKNQSEDKYFQKRSLLQGRRHDQCNKIQFNQSKSQFVDRIMQSSMQSQDDQLSSQKKLQKNKQTRTIQAPQSSLQFLTQMTYEQIASEVIKHLKILQEINSSHQEIEQKVSKNQEQILSQIELPQNQHQSSTVKLQHKLNEHQRQNNKVSPSSSCYLRQSSERLQLSLSQKKQILNKFNEQQTIMMRKMIESMILFRQMKRDFRITNSRTENQFEDSQNQNRSQKNIKQVNKDHKARSQLKKKRVSFNLGLNDNQHYHYLTKSVPNQGKLQFKKLENLMRDRQMKQSIVDSMGLDSSNNQNSFISIVQKQLDKINKSYESSKKQSN